MLQKAGNGLLSGIHTIDAGLMYGPNWREIESQQRTEFDQQKRLKEMQAQALQLQLAQAQKASVLPDQIAASMRTAGMPRLQATSPDASGLSELTPQRPSDFQQMLGASQSLLRQGNVPGSDTLLEQAKARMPKQDGSGFGNVNPGDYTPQSLAKYAQTRNYSDLVRQYAPPTPWIGMIGGGLGVVPRVGGKGGAPTMLTTPEQEAAAAAAAAAEEARQKQAAEALAKAKADLPRIEQNTTEAIKVITDLKNHPGLKYITGLSSKLPIVPGTAQAGADALAEQVQGQTFLRAYETLKGGGQITEVEGKKAEAAVARLKRTQNTEDYVAALGDLQDVLNKGIQRARKSAGVGESAASPQGKSIKRTGRDKSGRKVVEYSDGSVAYGD